jgi:hypothetical protein
MSLKKYYIDRSVTITRLFKTNPAISNDCEVISFGLSFYQKYTITWEGFCYISSSLLSITEKQYYAIVRYLNTHQGDYSELYLGDCPIIKDLNIDKW